MQGGEEGNTSEGRRTRWQEDTRTGGLEEMGAKVQMRLRRVQKCKGEVKAVVGQKS
jgi:hypothetical protein